VDAWLRCSVHLPVEPHAGLPAIHHAPDGRLPALKPLRSRISDARLRRG